ncbi:MAG: GAF domain-containing protein [Chloroflexales bacterium]|nr:GAF domain-containing protein [Chloroflexales bacterium]
MSAASQSAVPERPLRVLVLDDDPMFGRQLLFALERSAELALSGAAVSTAEEALATVDEASTPYDIFLVDQRLGPGPDGISVLEQLLERSPRSGGVVFTLAGDVASGRRAHQVGAYRYLHKPFTVEELLLVLQTLRDWLQTREEVGWLQVINAFAEDAQKLHRREAIEQIIVQRGLDLGFDRAQLWVSPDGGTTVVGAAGASRLPLGGFAGAGAQPAASPYLTRVLDSPEPVIFRGLEHGTLFPAGQWAGTDPRLPVGEWVGLPLWAGERVRGALLLDRLEERGDISADRKLLQALSLFGRQVAAALERATLAGEERRRSLETAILAGIGRLISGEAAGRPYAELLERVRQEVGKLVTVDNFYVAIRSASSGWLDYLISVEGGELQTREPARRVHELIDRVVTLNRSVLLRKGQALWPRRRLRPGGPAPAQGQSPLSRLGVPLQVEGRAIGALVVQGAGDGQYGEEQQRILEAVAAQIAGPLHNRRLREAAEQTSRRLTVMQRAGEALMALEDPEEEHLWHTTLTMITAGFGLGYNLAALFMLQRGGTLLRGRLGIGQGTLREAQRAWESAAVREMSFEQYRDLLARGMLGPPTPIDAPIRALEFPLAEADALSEAISERGKERHIRVSAAEFTTQLPPALQAILPPWEYEVLPLMAGERRLGVLVVGNPHLRRPLDEMPFDQLAAWISQVGIIRESWRQREAGEGLAAVSREVLAGAGSRPLQETLNLLCKSARTLMRSSCAVIYPFANSPASGLPRLDLERAGSDGLRYGLQPADQRGSGGMTEQLLATRKLIAVEDVTELSWYSQTHPGSSFLQREGIQAFFAAVILEQATGAPRGLLYVSYRSTPGFSERDKATASALADLAGQAIRNHDDQAVIRARADKAEAARRERERELAIVADLLKGTLALKYEQPDQALEELARLILGQGEALLQRQDIRLGLVLRLWVRDQSSGGAREIRREFFLVDDTMVQDDQADIYAGITGLAFQTGEDQLVDDVRAPEWRDIYAGQYEGGTRSELDVLIRLEERTLGLITVESPRVGAFSQVDRDALRRLADGAALALDTGQHQRQLQELLKAARPMIEAHDLDTTLRAVLDQILQVAPELDVVTIWYWDGERRALVPGVFHGVRDTALLMDDRAILPDTALGRVMQSPDPVWAENAARNPVMAGRFVAAEAISSAVAFPLRVGDGAEDEAADDSEPITLAAPDGTTRKVVGMLFLNYRHHHRFTRHEQTLFPLVAAIVAACIRDTLALERLRKQRQRLAATTDLARAVGATIDMDETLRTMLASVKGLLTAPAREIELCLLLAEERSDLLTFAPASRAFYNWAYIEANQALPLDNGRRSIAARVARAAITTHRSTAVNVRDVRDDPDYLTANAPTRAQLSLALLSPDTEALLGVLVIEANHVNAFSRDDELLVEALGPIISLAIKGAREQEERRFHASVAGVTAWVGEIAHDIGTAISDAQRTIYRLRGALEGEQAQRLAAINENLSRLSALISAPLKGASSSTLELNQWLPAQIQQIIAGRAGPPVELRYKLAPRPLYVSVPAALLERVLGHLIRNGRQARREGCAFTISTAHEGRNAYISVANNGPPIPSGLVERLFIDRIADPGRAEGEGGMGLLLSRWMMRHMGGDLILASPESPVTFGLWLPLATGQAPLQGETDEQLAADQGADRR